VAKSAAAASIRRFTVIIFNDLEAGPEAIVLVVEISMYPAGVDRADGTLAVSTIPR
jgi:hypothetical protein